MQIFYAASGGVFNPRWVIKELSECGFCAEAPTGGTMNRRQFVAVLLVAMKKGLFICLACLLLGATAAEADIRSIHAASIHLISPLIALKITSCTFIARSAADWG